LRPHYWPAPLASTAHRPSYTPHANRSKADHKRLAPGPPPLVTAHDLHPRSVSSTASSTINGSAPLATWAPAPPSAAAHAGDPHDAAFGHPSACASLDSKTHPGAFDSPRQVAPALALHPRDGHNHQTLRSP